MKGKLALVTGASQGIGRSCAQVLAEAGARVVVASRNLEKCQAVVDGIRGRGHEAEAARLDVCDYEGVRRLFGDLLQRFGGVEILVNNAGIARDNLLIRMKPEDWEAVISTNLTGAYHCTREALPGMLKKRYGRIINVASVVGLMGNPGQCNYVAAKAGLIGFTKSIAREVASRGITVNAVAPGYIDTEMTRNLSEASRERLVSAIPLGRVGTDLDVASGVRFLASEEAGYITGHVLQINGGLYT
ncbi:MAG: 3-oxoacyl-[acyl-carrier-protein] reductase [Acidobacteria bacterium]|nr:3-oxoacyl-[acyl-carrier-protein] reductase [Acidobacteriota bacterium]